MTVMNADSVCKIMEMAILTGELKPRERLVESELITKFNVKRFTIRKAIQELAHRGFVELTPNKGARVADITDQELEDLYCVRLNLELLAAELLIKKITPPKMSLLKKIHKKYARAVEKQVVEEMVMINEEFHRTLYRMTENRFLSESLERLTNGIFALRYNAYILLGMFQVSVDQHEAIINALDQRDLEKLKACTMDNIIYPKMIYDSRKNKQSDAIDALGVVDGPLRRVGKGNGRKK
jgi:DNA-binding GntR family transcriptional regulator